MLASPCRLQAVNNAQHTAQLLAPACGMHGLSCRACTAARQATRRRFSPAGPRQRARRAALARHPRSAPTRSAERWPSPSATGTAVPGNWLCIEVRFAGCTGGLRAPHSIKATGSQAAAGCPLSTHLRVTCHKLKQDALGCVVGHVVAASQPLVRDHLRQWAGRASKDGIGAETAGWQAPASAAAQAAHSA